MEAKGLPVQARCLPDGRLGLPRPRPRSSASPSTWPTSAWPASRRSRPERSRTPGRS
ncbi:MAG: hypothetical protein M0C28_47530 [Candidatus Moduliflexus flocculans]|nr:hypothetical protein [Candidatus Moduliflexus flocculans]